MAIRFTQPYSSGMAYANFTATYVGMVCETYSHLYVVVLAYTLSQLVVLPFLACELC